MGPGRVVVAPPAIPKHAPAVLVRVRVSGSPAGAWLGAGAFRRSTRGDRAERVVQDGTFYSGTPLPERIDGRQESLSRGNGPIAAAAGSARGRFVLGWFRHSCWGS